MEDFGILEVGSVISIKHRYSSRYENYEIVSFEGERNIEFNQYYAYKVNANYDKVIGAKELIFFPKSKKYIQKGTDYYLNKKGKGELVVSKDIEESNSKLQQMGKVLKYDGEKPTYLMLREEYKQYIKPFWLELNNLSKKYPQYFYKNYGHLFLSDSDKLSVYTLSNWKRDNDVEPVKTIPNDVKKEYEKLKEIFLVEYYDDELKTSNKKIISKALEDGIYLELIKKGQLNTLALKEILDSVKLKLPTKLEKAQAEVSVEGLTYEKEVEKEENIKKFKEKIIFYFKKYYDGIINRYVDDKTKVIEKYLDFLKGKSLYKNDNQAKIDFSNYLGEKYEEIYSKKYRTTEYKFGSSINNLFSVKKYFSDGFAIKNNWKEIIKELGTEKADLIFSTYVNNLIKQIPIRIVSNLPKVVWGELNRSSPIGFDSELKLEFDNGFELYVKNKTIIAGGYNIQIAHLRTIFHFSINGKVRSDEEIQKAYKEFVPVKEKEVVSASSDKEYLESKLIASQDLLEVLDATQGDEKDIEYIKNMIEVTKDLISLLK
jgi:hypothetical protein